MLMLQPEGRYIISPGRESWGSSNCGPNPTGTAPHTCERGGPARNPAQLTDKNLVENQHDPIRAIGILLSAGVAGAGGVGLESALGDHFGDV